MNRTEALLVSYVEASPLLAVDVRPHIEDQQDGAAFRRNEQW
jgi:hypothetical protein